MDETEIKQVYGGETFKRGKDYFRDGRAINAVKLGDGVFAEVLGTEKYQTGVRLDNLESTCSCPVGYNCKHGVAVALLSLNKGYLDGDRIVKEVADAGSFQLVKMLEQLIHDDPFLALKVQEIMEGGSKTGANPALASSVEKQLKGMFRSIESRGYADEEFVETFSKFVKTHESNMSKELVFYALEFLVKRCEDYGYFYDDYTDSYFGDVVFESLCDALVKKQLNEDDFIRLHKLEDEDEYDMLDTFLVKLTEPENAIALVDLSKHIRKLLGEDLLYVEFLINAGKKEEAIRILANRCREFGERECFQLYMKIDKDEAIRFAIDKKFYSSLMSYYHQTGAHGEVISTFRRFLDETAKTGRKATDFFPFEAVFDSLKRSKPADYPDLCRSLFDLCLRQGYEYDVCVEISLALNDPELVKLILEKAKSSPDSLGTEPRIKLLKRLSLSDPEIAKNELERWAERLIEEKNDGSYGEAVRCALALKEIMNNDEWARYLRGLSNRHYRKINLWKRLKATGIMSIPSSRKTSKAKECAEGRTR